MDDEQALETFTNILNLLSEKPYDFSLHLQHVRIANSLQGMDTEARAALETFTSFYATGDDVWMPLIEAKEASTDMTSAQSVLELLALYEQAEGDYLCEYPFPTRNASLKLFRIHSYPDLETAYRVRSQSLRSIHIRRRHEARGVWRNFLNRMDETASDGRVQ